MATTDARLETRGRSLLARALLRGLVFVAWVLLVVVVVDYVLARRFVARLRSVPPPEDLFVARGVPQATVKRLGFFRNIKRSAFVRALPAKRPGVVRVCAFGDSFTEGTEVDDSHDYPTLLGELFRQRGVSHVEVLNFGCTWYGFHQAYVLWDDVGRTYGCDRILLGPATFFPDRDTSFNHAGAASPYYLHARYVLDGADVRLVEVAGDTVEERFETFFRFVPPLAYVRYETAPPVFLRAGLPEGRVLMNPFYYRRDGIAAEAYETYRVLFRRMAASGVEVILGGEGPIVQTAARLDTPALHAFLVAVPKEFPYQAPRNHYGPFGNQALAAEFFALLTGEPVPVPVLRAEPIEPAPRGAAAGPRAALASFDAIAVALGDVEIGHFVTGNLATDRQGSPGLLRASGIVTLVHVGGSTPSRAGRESSLVDGCYLPVARSLGDGEPVTLEVEGAPGPSARRIGELRLLDPRVDLGRLDLGSLRIEDWPLLEEHNLNLVARDGDDLARAVPETTPVTLRVGGTALLRGQRVGKQVRLSPVEGSCFRLRANEGGLARAAELPAAGTYDLVLRRGAAVTRLPLAGWQKILADVPTLSPPLATGARLPARGLAE